jgi:hypothetical protein
MVVNLVRMGHNRRANITGGLVGNFYLRYVDLEWRRKVIIP